MDATIPEIVEQEGMAREIVELAPGLAQDGRHATAAMLGTTGCRRVRGMDLRGKPVDLRPRGRWR